MERVEQIRIIHLLAYLSIGGLSSLTVWMLILLPSFLAGKAWSSQKIGWAMGSYFLVQLAVQVFAGHLANRWGNVPTALSGAGCALAGCFFYLGALQNPDLVFAGRVLHGCGAALISSGALIQLIQSVPTELRGRMIGYFGLPGFVMLGVGPALSEWFVATWGFQGTFLALLGCFLLITWFLTRLPRPLVPGGKRRAPFSRALRNVFPRLKIILLFSVAFGLSFSAWNTFLAPLLLPLGRGVVSSFGMGYAAGAVLSRTGISHRLEQGWLRLLGVSTLILYGLTLAIIPQLSGTWSLVAAGSVMGISHGVYYPSLSSLATERFHTLHVSHAMSLYIAASSLGMFFGPPMWGVLVDWLSYGPVFAAAGLLLAGATLAFLVTESPMTKSKKSRRFLDRRAG